jgi:glutamate dehydrogenase
MKEASLLFCLPDNPFFLFNDESGHAVQEATYACKIISGSLLSGLCILILSFLADCGWIFAQHFCNRLGPAYLQLRNVLDESNSAHAEVLNDIKRRFREETFTRESIRQVIHAHPELVSYVLKCLK